MAEDNASTPKLRAVCTEEDIKQCRQKCALQHTMKHPLRPKPQRVS